MTVHGQDSVAAPERVRAYQWSPFHEWLAAQGAPVHRGYYIEDLRTVPLGRWEQRECDAAFLELAGQEGVTSSYVLEIPPGGQTAPFRVAVDEALYVLQGRGLASIRPAGSTWDKTFEWQDHSLFLVPSNHEYVLSNTQGGQPSRLLVVNYLPLAMAISPNPAAMFENPVVDPLALQGGGLGNIYSEARVAKDDSYGRERDVWISGFFPDMQAWDRLRPDRGRGAMSRHVMIWFPKSPITAHMSVFPARTYKKAHRHGPGFVIVIPAGEGYSVMWPEGRERVIVPWHEGSCFVPPMRWWHQHFNVSSDPNRYLAIHPPRPLMGMSERVEDPSRDQIEYVEEDPWIRQRFEEELAKRNMTSDMPEQAWQDREFEWDYGES